MAEGVTFPSSSHDAGRLPSRLPLFIDTNLDTHLVLDISPDDMVGHLKGRIRIEHSSCFPHIGEVLIQAMQVKRKAFYYNLSDSMPIKSAFSGTNGTWFIHLNLVPASHTMRSHAEVVGVVRESGGEPEKHKVLQAGHDASLLPSMCECGSQVIITMGCSTEKGLIQMLSSNDQSNSLAVSLFEKPSAQGNSQLSNVTGSRIQNLYASSNSKIFMGGKIGDSLILLDTSQNELNDELGVSSSEVDTRLDLGGSEVNMVTKADEVVGSDNQKEKEGVADHGNIGLEDNVNALVSEKEKSGKRHKAESISREKKKQKKENNLTFDVPVRDQLTEQKPENGKYNKKMSELEKRLGKNEFPKKKSDMDETFHFSSTETNREMTVEALNSSSMNTDENSKSETIPKEVAGKEFKEADVSRDATTAGSSAIVASTFLFSKEYSEKIEPLQQVSTLQFSMHETCSSSRDQVTDVYLNETPIIYLDYPVMESKEAIVVEEAEKTSDDQYLGSSNPNDNQNITDIFDLPSGQSAMPEFVNSMVNKISKEGGTEESLVHIHAKDSCRQCGKEPEGAGTFGGAIMPIPATVDLTVPLLLGDKKSKHRKSRSQKTKLLGKETSEDNAIHDLVTETNRKIAGQTLSSSNSGIGISKEPSVSYVQGSCMVNVEGEDSHDDVCGACGDGGDLICCDSCPSTFHGECAGLKVFPRGDWHCRNCVCKFCGGSRVSSFKQGTTCLLLSCSQCEQKYHKECVSYSGIVPSNEFDIFCGHSCKKIFKKMRKMLGIERRLDSGFCLRLVRRLDETSYSYGPARVAKCNSKVAIALKIMDDAFQPFTDTQSETNLIHNIICNYGSNISRLNFSKFHTFVLEKDDEIISVASIRIHGTKLAELPFVCTVEEHMGLGMLRRLLGGIELVLQKLKVKKLVVPVSSKPNKLKDMWKYKFGFRPSKVKVHRQINMFIYPGLDILEKSILHTEPAKVTDSTR